MQFTKVHGLGNDFVLFEALDGEQTDFNALAPRICDRHTGVGADGILLVLKSDTADIRMRIINSDGSEAEMCGNGIRAFSKYVFERGIVEKTAFSVETLAGIMRPALTVENGTVTGVTVDMGEPFLDAKDVPVLCDAQRCIGQTITAGGRTFRYTSLLVGVPHTVIPVDDPKDPVYMQIGAEIERADVFPKRTNVNFIRVLNDHEIEARTFERGCGPTLACGTGSCSSAVACALNGLTGRTVDVHIALGTLRIEWAEDNHIYMTGPASISFTGDYEV